MFSTYIPSQKYYLVRILNTSQSDEKFKKKINHVKDAKNINYA